MKVKLLIGTTILFSSLNLTAMEYPRILYGWLFKKLQLKNLLYQGPNNEQILQFKQSLESLDIGAVNNCLSYMPINEPIKHDQGNCLHVVCVVYAPSEEAEQKKAELLKFLLEHGADPNQKNNRGQIPAHLMLENFVIDRLFGVERIKVNLYKIFAEHGTDFSLVESGNVSVFSLCANFLKKSLQEMKKTKEDLKIVKHIDNTHSVARALGYRRILAYQTIKTNFEKDMCEILCSSKSPSQKLLQRQLLYIFITEGFYWQLQSVLQKFPDVISEYEVKVAAVDKDTSRNGKKIYDMISKTLYIQHPDRQYSRLAHVPKELRTEITRYGLSEFIKQ